MDFLTILEASIVVEPALSTPSSINDNVCTRPDPYSGDPTPEVQVQGHQQHIF